MLLRSFACQENKSKHAYVEIYVVEAFFYIGAYFQSDKSYEVNSFLY